VYAPAAAPKWNQAANAVSNLLDRSSHLGVIILHRAKEFALNRYPTYSRDG
jgi:hypothetical protein